MYPVPVSIYCGLPGLAATCGRPLALIRKRSASGMLPSECPLAVIGHGALCGLELRFLSPPFYLGKVFVFIEETQLSTYTKKRVTVPRRNPKPKMFLVMSFMMVKTVSTDSGLESSATMRLDDCDNLEIVPPTGR